MIGSRLVVSFALLTTLLAAQLAVGSVAEAVGAADAPSSQAARDVAR